MTINLTWDEMDDLDPVPTEVPGGTCYCCGEGGGLVCGDCTGRYAPYTYCSTCHPHENHSGEDDGAWEYCPERPARYL